ncbi:hypothetical protein NPX13_g6274 [Xylaria arbuscula]|uniref:Azaphilone pigments biosynthesis cluster protein L N-terminal domain-containing protein n=1 Tax=Xylaria arbuscula TaxID=114810 RepID=A0A9W8NCV0_9PEZI|nr:hypothetical protein NPX13_g6274 [Xylaria arbuscula]
MSGPQDAIAFLGVAELGFRCIFSLYEFVQDLKQAPIEVKAILTQLGPLEQCLKQLSSFQSASEDTKEAIQRYGLTQAVTGCEVSCEKLQKHLQDWSANQHHRLRPRVRYRLNKAVIDAALKEISSTKDTAILTVSAIQLCLSESRHNTSNTDMMPRHDAQVRTSQGPGNPIIEANSLEDGSQTFKKQVSVSGQNNTVGMSGWAAVELAKLGHGAHLQKFHEHVAITEGSQGNNVGIHGYN